MDIVFQKTLAKHCTLPPLVVDEEEVKSLLDGLCPDEVRHESRYARFSRRRR